MNGIATTIATVPWPDSVAISQDRVVSGQPSASTLVLDEGTRSQVGLWKVEPGEFTTRLTGYREFIHIVEGMGKLIHDDGQTSNLRPGIVVVLPEGWSGRWVIETALVKSYAIVRSG